MSAPARRDLPKWLEVLCLARIPLAVLLFFVALLFPPTMRLRTERIQGLWMLTSRATVKETSFAGFRYVLAQRVFPDGGDKSRNMGARYGATEYEVSWLLWTLEFAIFTAVVIWLFRTARSLDPYAGLEKRRFVDPSGHFEFTAQLVSLTGSQAQLRKKSGELINIELDALSEEDQLWIHSEIARRVKASGE